MRTFLLSIFALSMLATTPAGAINLSCKSMWAESEWVLCPAEALTTRPDRNGHGEDRGNGGGGSGGGGSGGGGSGGGGEGGSKPGHGHGDKNHEHSGPPGQEGK